MATVKLGISSLINYQRNDRGVADTPEKIGKSLTYFLTALAGKTYKIQNATFSELPSISKVRKVFLTIIFVLLSPISIPLSLLGMVFTHLSKSHQKSLKAHRNFQHEQGDLQLKRKQYQKKLQQIGDITQRALACVDCKNVTINPKILLPCQHIICDSCDQSRGKMGQLGLCGDSSCQEPVLLSFPFSFATRLARSILNHPVSNNRLPDFQQQTLRALSLTEFAQVELAKASAEEILRQINLQDLIDGVVFRFDNFVSRVFFENFANTIPKIHLPGLSPQVNLGCIMQKQSRVIITLPVKQNTKNIPKIFEVTSLGFLKTSVPARAALPPVVPTLT